jgi:hypothetical protein
MAGCQSVSGILAECPAPVIGRTDPGENDMAAERHNVLVVPLSDGYAVSCSCGWIGGTHEAPGPAEREAADHEADPDSTVTPRRFLHYDCR